MRELFIRLNAAMLVTAALGAAAHGASLRSVTDESARGSALIALALFGVLGVAALLGFLRLKLRGVTVVSVSLLALAAGGGGASLALLDVGGLTVGVPTVLCGLAAFGQLVATNLLPDSNHPLVLREEARLTALPPERRRRHLLIRVAGGLGLAAAATVATLISFFWLHGPVAWFYGGSGALGLVFAATPLIAALRLRARRL